MIEVKLDIWFWLYILFPFYSVGLIIYLRKLKVKLDKERFERCSRHVTGVCVEKYKGYRRMRTNYHKGNHIFYYNVWKYSYNGKQMKGVIRLESEAFWSEVGEETILGVNPENPKEIVKISDGYKEEVKGNLTKTVLTVIVCWLIFGVAMLYM